MVEKYKGENRKKIEKQRSREWEKWKSKKI